MTLTGMNQMEKIMKSRLPLHTTARTKTVATIGPASREPETLTKLIDIGVDVFRLNMAHGSLEAQQENLDRIRQAAANANQPVATLVDLSGPKIRLGQLAQDPLKCAPNDRLRFIRGEIAAEPHDLVTNYAPLLNELQVGDTVMLTDGSVRLEVVEKTDEMASCQVIDGGVVRSRQGVNLPGVNLSVPAMDEDDRRFAVWAGDQGVDFISLSFVRKPDEIIELKEILRQRGSNAQVIAKIEKREAMDNLEAIVEASDGIMVARGDLGVEIDIAQTALAQKRIIHVCRQQGKPVIVATQMLESMHQSQRPTRAEVADVSNAILDGADACMMSGETAIGDFPLDAARMMQRIMIETEKMLHRQPSRTDSLKNEEHDYSTAVVFGASQVAKQLEARLVVLATDDSDVLLSKSKLRDFIPTLCLTKSDVSYRRTCLFWGIYSVFDTQANDLEAIRVAARQWLDGKTEVRPADTMVIVSDQVQDESGLDTIQVKRI